MESTFTDYETRFVLGEMIKSSSIDVPLLAEFIKAHNVEQNWGHMQLPHGRNMYQCMSAIEKMLPVYVPPPLNPASLKRKSFGELGDNPIKRQAVMTSTELAIPPRIIQPRPPPNGYTNMAPVSNGPSLTMSGKKRGRPSKADKEAQARANYPRSEYPPITPAPLAAPMARVPQREYISSPGYEIASSSADQNLSKRSRPSESSPAAGTYPLPSPASATETPRALPEPFEQVETLSPRDRGYPPHTGPLPLQLQQPSQVQHHSPQPHAQPPPPPPMSVPGRQPPAYEQYRGPDPIFPDRDRSMRDTSSAPPVQN